MTTTPPQQWADTAALAAALPETPQITQERAEQINRERGVHLVRHTIVVHQEGISADYLKTVLQALETAGMPSNAVLEIERAQPTASIRVAARWTIQHPQPAPEPSPGPVAGL